MTPHPGDPPSEGRVVDLDDPAVQGHLAAEEDADELINRVERDGLLITEHADGDGDGLAVYQLVGQRFLVTTVVHEECSIEELHDPGKLAQLEAELTEMATTQLHAVGVDVDAERKRFVRALDRMDRISELETRVAQLEAENRVLRTAAR